MSKDRASSAPDRPGRQGRLRDSLAAVSHDVDLHGFRAFRTEMGERLRASGHLGLKRFLALDGQAYHDGALDARTKELLGLVASLVLRCDDCVTYHLEQCVDLGVGRAELLDAFNVGLVVGGSITIPHLRRAVATLDALLEEREGQG